jgi:hypothetical protein
MTLKEKLREQENVVFPAGKIVLLDGREIDCYPREKGCDCNVDYNNLELDTTGHYLSFGKKGHQKDYIEELDVFLEKQLFIDNAFFLFQNRERIMQDSRMFLAPVAAENVLAYTGTSGFRNPTLGVYLEWWVHCEGAVRTAANGTKSLIYRLAGSPLTGVNSCVAVCEDGTEEKLQLRSFSDYWLSFIKINQRYSPAKACYQAYSLQEVLDILNSLPSSRI